MMNFTLALKALLIFSVISFCFVDRADSSEFIDQKYDHSEYLNNTKDKKGENSKKMESKIILKAVLSTTYGRNIKEVAEDVAEDYLDKEKLAHIAILASALSSGKIKYENRNFDINLNYNRPEVSFGYRVSF